MRVTLASGLEDLYVDSDGTAVVMIDNAVLALSKLSTIVLQVLSAHGADGVESGDLWEIVRHAVGDPPGDVDGEAVVAGVLRQLQTAGLARWVAER
ncbi:hypothetical protein [uncultured Nocardioides sp.]|uniref:hypothetical protein n=1 Tax=uncultured Nocardioides sp. TaxID=198441 RepID=UPI002637A625|nr:hypothetical protein [uncultured Nocardioides sp.]